eukprot:jgi/Chlat1/6368/Chrsp44S05831
MTRGKQKIDAQKRAAEKNAPSKGSQLDAQKAGLKALCPICKVQLAHSKLLAAHYEAKHPKETPPATSS